jgi:exodeoxyribonuclease V alpha subunit
LKGISEFNINTIYKIEGVFDSPPYYNNNDYIVGPLTVHAVNDCNKCPDYITVSGSFTYIQQQKCIVKGTITEYHGEKQLRVQQIEYKKPTGTEEIIAYMSSDMIKGVGPKTAEKIVNGFERKNKHHKGFGADTLDIIENDYEKITIVPGITFEKARKIHESVVANLINQKTILYLNKITNNSLTTGLIQKLIKKYGNNTVSIIQEDPYILSELPGIGFKKADGIAIKSGHSYNSLSRIKNAVKYIIKNAEAYGHCYLLKDSLFRDLSKLVNTGSYTLEYEDYSSKLDKIVSIGEIIQDNGMYYSVSVYYKELFCADTLKEYTTKQPDLELDNSIIDDSLLEFKTREGFELETRQKEFIYNFFKAPVSILNGRAGTGKSTTINALLFVIDKNMSIDYRLIAPTGKAAKRITELTKKEATTIHRLLCVQEDGTFFYDKDNKLETDLIILDEASMLNIHLFTSLLEAIDITRTSFLIIGNVDQLPAIGPGHILNDLLLSKTIQSTTLNVIKRQGRESTIIMNAEKIIKGKMIITSQNGKKDFLVEYEEDAYELQKKISKYYNILIKKWGLDYQDIQIICPQREGTLGTKTFNSIIQGYHEDNKKETMTIKNKSFRIGDRVVHCKNDYNAVHYTKSGNSYCEKFNKYNKTITGIFNGDTGTVHDIKTTEEKKQLIVKYDNIYIMYESFENIELAYALTVHKLQGSQSDIVIIPVHSTNYIMLNKNLGYTAVTRAQKMVIIVGQESAIKHMVTNNNTRRNTRLKELIKGRA